jgi:hypothetical protein
VSVTGRKLINFILMHFSTSRPNFLNQPPKVSLSGTKLATHLYARAVATYPMKNALGECQWHPICPCVYERHDRGGRSVRVSHGNLN